MTIEELIKLHGRERIEQAVADLQPGGLLEGRLGRDLAAQYPVAHAVLEAVGKENREVFWDRKYRPSECVLVDSGVPHRIRRGYTLPDPPEGDRTARGVEIPQELVDGLIEAAELRKDLVLRADCATTQAEAAVDQETAAEQAIIDYIRQQQQAATETTKAAEGAGPQSS